MTSRTYGTLKILRDGQLRFQVEPQVAIRLTRVFQEARLQRDGQIMLAGTPANLVDVDWFLQRYPLVVSGRGSQSRAWIAERAAAQVAVMDDVQRVLIGDRPPPDVAMALPPRQYQAQAAYVVQQTGQLLCADELGIGKTVTALTMIAMTQAFPVAVVVPPHLLDHWESQIAKFLPSLMVHTIASRTPYKVDADVLLFSYHRTSLWGPHLLGKIRTIVFDEAQELRRRESDKYRGCMLLAQDADYRLGLSATPIYNYGGEFHNVFEILAPGRLGSWIEFTKAWCTDAYNTRRTKLANPKAFGAFLREQGLMVRRTRAQVERELPGRNDAIEYLEWDESPARRENADALRLAQLVLERQGSNFDQMRAAQELSAQARLATGVSKAPGVAAFVRMLVEQSGEPLVLFGWHHAVYEYWRRELDDLGISWYTGRESLTAKRRALRAFTAGDTNVLVMSLRSGQGVDGLQERCCRIVFGELDWSPGVMEQCIGRLYRDGQLHPVIVYWMIAKGGCDPVMADVLGVKSGQMRGVRQQFGDEEVAAQVDPDHIRRLAEDYLRRAKRPIPKAVAKH